MQIVNLATNDAASLSLSEFAVLAIAPELAPNSILAGGAKTEWDRSTLGGSVAEKEGARGKESAEKKQNGKAAAWKRVLCL